MSVKTGLLMIIIVLECNTQTIRCNETIFGSIDTIRQTDTFLLDIDIDVLIVTANTCASNVSFDAGISSNTDGAFSVTSCPGNEVGSIGTFAEESIIRNFIPNIRVFSINFGETGNYSLTLECVFFDNEPERIECGDIINGSVARSEIDRYILSGCNELQNFTVSLCGGNTDFDTQIRVDSVSQNGFIGYNDDFGVECSPASEVTIGPNDVNSFNDDFSVKVSGFDQHSFGDYTLFVTCGFNDPSLSSCPPTQSPSITPTISPTISPSSTPTIPPTASPSSIPTTNPSITPTVTPSFTPTSIPSKTPSLAPSLTPTLNPSVTPTKSPSFIPTLTPSFTPTIIRSSTPTNNPSSTPTLIPSLIPTNIPTIAPSFIPTKNPSSIPTLIPSLIPTNTPTVGPSFIPVNNVDDVEEDQDQDNDNDDDIDNIDDDDDSDDDSEDDSQDYDGQSIGLFNIQDINPLNDQYIAYILIFGSFLLGMISSFICIQINFYIYSKYFETSKYNTIYSCDISSQT